MCRADHSDSRAESVAFRAGTRESADDGVNLNRAFVDGAGKHAGAGGHHASDRRVRARPHLAARARGARPALRRRRGAFRLVRQLSSAGRSASKAAQIEETARWFGTPLIMVYQNATPGLRPPSGMGGDVMGRGRVTRPG